MVEVDYNQLVNIGIAGIVLLWFMFRLEDKLEKLNITLQDLPDKLANKLKKN